MKKLLLFAGIIICTALIHNTQAIPAFARKYQLSCQTCHNPAPRLRPFGNEFAGNAFRMPDQEAPRYFIPTGDPQLNLLRELPLAVRLEGFLGIKEEAPQKFDFASPYIVKLMSGGELTNRIAYYFYFYFDERGEVAGVEDAFVMFNDLFGIDLDLYVGQFQVADPLFKNELRLTLSEYEIYKLRPGSSRANLSYDKGVMATLGLETGTEIVVSVLNGNGLTDADDLRIFDYDKYKNFAVRVSQDVGNNLRLGAFGYFGKEEQNIYTHPLNKIVYFGPDASLTFGDKFELNLQYLFRRDSDLLSDPESPVMKSAKTSGGFAELIYTPKGIESKWYFAGLINYIDSDLDIYRYRSTSLHAGYMIKRNIRLAAEYTLYEKESGHLMNQFSVGFSTAF